MSFNYEEISHNEAKDLLRQWRENNERRGKEVLELWDVVLREDVNKLGNEKHVILEQVIYAALDCHMYCIAMLCLVMLSNEFPGSLRVMKLKAAVLEAEEKFDEALELLDNIIKVDETNSAARKRRIAILKAQGYIVEAIKELVDYLKKFMSDVEAWQELCNLYLQVQDYSRAVFCAEELLLHQPHSHLHHQRLADIRYTMGGIENLELAKLYYCQSVKLNPDNMRSLLGLYLTTTNLLNHYKSSGNSGKRKEVWKLCHWAQSKATKQTQPTSQLSQMMLSLAITE
ncbi:ER membrane protein complex subunit 2-like [Bombyx mandarina]|uniref:ER membrane protein complex subunit 2 n=2 Tax=Bombyx TaxID=7090 RepID=A0A8R2QSG3_BOMMO|nr:ER membrane protein complex subunit 2-like [Bombyx mandarina]XP_037867731.1 ER membrane protein complex subunit 2 [Bombyx mori]